MYSESTVYLDRELRKLKPAESFKLARILRVQDSWKKLMAIVPKDDDSDLPRFNIEHIRYSFEHTRAHGTLESKPSFSLVATSNLRSTIEQAAAQQQGNAVEIFLSEWGTMGKKRPTLRLLLSLLTKAELFRAADYVAGELLNEELPKRPEFGPAAPVDISEETDTASKDNEKLANLDRDESRTFGSASSRVVDNETIDPNATSNNDSFEEGNAQSTKLIDSSRGERGCKEQLQSDEETSNVRRTDIWDPTRFNGKENNSVEEEGGEQTLDQREMPSDELPVFLNEFERRTSKFHREASPEELSVLSNDSRGGTTR
ncbi:unnamed protein product, partial [Heterotrigona itama]